MTSIIFFFIFVPILSVILLSVNFIFAPHKPYKEKKTPFECGYHSFLSQNRTQFTISFFIFALLFLIFDLEIVLIYPYSVSSYANNIYGLVSMIIFTLVLTVGFIFELGKNALKIESKQNLAYNDKLESGKTNFGLLPLYSGFEYNKYNVYIIIAIYIVLTIVNKKFLFFYFDALNLGVLIFLISSIFALINIKVISYIKGYSLTFNIYHYSLAFFLGLLSYILYLYGSLILDSIACLTLTSCIIPLDILVIPLNKFKLLIPTSLAHYIHNCSILIVDKIMCLSTMKGSAGLGGSAGSAGSAGSGGSAYSVNQSRSMSISSLVNSPYRLLGLQLETDRNAVLAARRANNDSRFYTNLSDLGWNLNNKPNEIALLYDYIDNHTTTEAEKITFEQAYYSHHPLSSDKINQSINRIAINPTLIARLKSS
jgi:NADH-ubiquinone oxidoreductase chain 3